MPLPVFTAPGLPFYPGSPTFDPDGITDLEVWLHGAEKVITFPYSAESQEVVWLLESLGFVATPVPSVLSGYGANPYGSGPYGG